MAVTPEGRSIMKKARKLFALLLAVCLIAALTGCGSAGSNTNHTSAPASNAENTAKADNGTGSEDKTDTPSQTPDESTEGQTSEESPSESQASGKDTLVIVFSATGTTKGVAEKIASITDADLYEILAAEPYSSADLNWNDKNSRTTIEMNDPNARPEIGSEDISLEGYKTIYIGYPIWWGDAPRIMSTFVESHNFDGITVIPFCTSSSSGIGRSGKNLSEQAGSGNWLDGKRFPGSVTEADLQSWIESLK